MDDELKHYGVKGMKWGVRRKRDGGSSGSKKPSKRSEQKATAKDLKKSYRKSDERRVKRASNSAARTYFKQERTNDFGTYKKMGSKLDLKTASLTESQVKNGRYRVARFRNIASKTISGMAGSTAGILAVSSGAAFIGVPAALAVAGLTNYATGGTYYSKQSRAYGKDRSDLQSRKRD